MAGNEMGQSSVQDWQAAIEAAGYRVGASLYTAETDHAPINNKQEHPVVDLPQTSTTSVDQSPRK